MSAASDFVALRRYYKAHEKKADGGINWQDLLNRAGNYISTSEAAQGAIGGGLAGGLSGLLPGQSVMRNALIGAGLGGGAGYLHQHGGELFGRHGGKANPQAPDAPPPNTQGALLADAARVSPRHAATEAPSLRLGGDGWSDATASTPEQHFTGPANPPGSLPASARQKELMQGYDVTERPEAVARKGVDQFTSTGRHALDSSFLSSWGGKQPENVEEAFNPGEAPDAFAAPPNGPLSELQLERMIRAHPEYFSRRR